MRVIGQPSHPVQREAVDQRDKRASGSVGVANCQRGQTNCARLVHGLRDPGDDGSQGRATTHREVGLELGNGSSWLGSATTAMSSAAS